MLDHAIEWLIRVHIRLWGKPATCQASKFNALQLSQQLEEQADTAHPFRIQHGVEDGLDFNICALHSLDASRSLQQKRFDRSEFRQHSHAIPNELSGKLNHDAAAGDDLVSSDITDPVVREIRSHDD
jgi:hypothetical protein